MRFLIALALALVASFADAQIIRSPGGSGSGGESIAFVFSEDTVRFAVQNYNVSLADEFAILTSGNGTSTAVVSTFTDYGRFWRSRKTSAAAINSGAGTHQTASSQLSFATIQNGFVAVMKFGIPNGLNATNNAWIGLFPAATGGPTGATNLTTIPNGVYLGFFNPEMTWRVCSHTSAAVRNCVDTGLAITTPGVVFEVTITAVDQIVHVRARRIDTAVPVVLFDADLANLPALTATLRWVDIVQTGPSSSSAIVLDFISTYVTYPY